VIPIQLSEKSDGRVAKGLQWMDDQIRALIAEIKKSKGSVKWWKSQRMMITFSALLPQQKPRTESHQLNLATFLAPP